MDRGCLENGHWRHATNKEAFHNSLLVISHPQSSLFIPGSVHSNAGSQSATPNWRTGRPHCFMKIFHCYYLLLLLVSCQTTAQEENLTIHFQTFGEGPPLLIINGGPGMSSEGFVPLAKLLAHNHQTIIFDQRGTGRSVLENINRSTVTMDLMVSDMERLRQQLQLDNWTVFGHSFGGMLAAYYAAKHPDKIAAMILSSSGGLDLELFSYLNINGKLSATDREQLNYWNQKIASGDTSYEARLKRGGHLAPAYLYDKTYVPIIAERLTQGNRQVNQLVFSDMREIGFDCKTALKGFSSPVLIIQGEEDIIDKKTAHKTAGILPNNKLVFIKKCAHYGWLEQPEAYIGAVEEFLKKVDN